MYIKDQTKKKRILEKKQNKRLKWTVFVDTSLDRDSRKSVGVDKAENVLDEDQKPAPGEI